MFSVEKVEGKLQNNEVGVSITLKDLTDLISVRHNDAMVKVEKLAREPSFGVLRKTRISHIKGKEIETYILNKKQAIAVGARLNDTLLMKVIDRLEELEKQANKPLTYEEVMQNALLLADKKVAELKNKILLDKPKVNFANAISGTTSNIDFETFAKALYDSEDINMGRNRLMKWFRNNGYMTSKNKPYQTMLDRGLMTLKEGSYVNQSTQELVTYTQPRITGKGQLYFTNKLIDEANSLF